jgi:intracellular sulfur oxidation DsrE/DsrF family protein
MDRRNIFKGALAAGLAGLGAIAARAETKGARRVVYHLADAEKVLFVLGNIHNHLEGAGGAQAISLAVVVHGPALRLFRADTPNPEMRNAAEEALKAGVAFHACAHTMAAQRLALADLTPGFVVAPKGGVVLLADLQAQGWAYLRP